VRTVSISQHLIDLEMPRPVPLVSAKKHQSPAETQTHCVEPVRPLHALCEYRRQTVSRCG
jgi:hypothetical protein